MALFGNEDMEEFLLFVRNFQMTLEASGTLTSGAKIQHLHTLVCGEVLCQLDIFSVGVGSNISVNLKLVIWV